jgi:hypothetical protein
MSVHPITEQPESTSSVFTLMSDEYIRFEYNYKPGCCCFSAKRTIITNMRLITRVIETPSICSRKTATGTEKNSMIFLTDINNIKQIQSAIPSSKNKWWIKCMEIFTCTCSNQQIDWLESCRGVENLAMDLTDYAAKRNDVQETLFIQKF